MKKIIAMIMISVLCLTSVVGCGSPNEKENSTGEEISKSEIAVGESGSILETRGEKEIFFAITDSADQMGLMTEILPEFTKSTGIEVRLFSGTTEEVLAMGANGDVDVILVDDIPKEQQFIADGYANKRADVMFSDCVLVGPKGDENSLQQNAQNRALDALGYIAKQELTFYSSLSNTIVHDTEKAIWEELGSDIPTDSWYHGEEKTTAELLPTVSENKGYMLVDRATFMELEPTLDLEIIIERDDRFYHQYGVLTISESNNDLISVEDAHALSKWLTSDEGQQAIKDFANGGKALYTPNAI